MSAIHWITHSIGYRLAPELPDWLHAILHVVLIGAPVGLAVVAIYWAYGRLRKRLSTRRTLAATKVTHGVLGNHVYAFILRFSRRDQIALGAVGLLAMPILYASFELPKIIVNNVIASGHFPFKLLGHDISQSQYLLLLCFLFLLAIGANGILKYWINVHKGRVGERLLRRLRLTVFKRWRAGAGGEKRSEVIPIIAQEVEPIGGFAGDSFSLPIFQGGSFLTIVTFMFVQDPILGTAALSLLPLQLSIIPRLQRKVNALAWERVAEVRTLSGELGDQIAASTRSISDIRTVGARLKRIERVRWKIHRKKFLIKSLNNFLIALTPFFFYSIGGYLVIEERLSLGALVAVLAAYKNFSAPLRELFKYYQAAEDVRVRFDAVSEFLGVGHVSGPTKHPANG
ncbi:MAG: ABC transporter ATP-binding protein [Boseongicola sp.]|nr:ABC transporter ATP-binding protein [Boseongicola sp.]MDD9978675.1 ABC transporter ATP-binding protein [Boseongicola sp.]